MESGGLRIVSFNILPRAYAMVANWAAGRGHEIVLVVTSPRSQEARYGVNNVTLPEAVPPTQDVLITSRLRRTAAPVIRALAPDLIISATFPHRIPALLTTYRALVRSICTPRPYLWDAVPIRFD
jgi:methionyl-tRNA formyltransferase